MENLDIRLIKGVGVPVIFPKHRVAKGLASCNQGRLDSNLMSTPLGLRLAVVQLVANAALGALRIMLVEPTFIAKKRRWATPGRPLGDPWATPERPLGEIR